MLAGGWGLLDRLIGLVFDGDLRCCGILGKAEGGGHQQGREQTGKSEMRALQVNDGSNWIDSTYFSGASSPGGPMDSAIRFLRSL